MVFTFYQWIKLSLDQEKFNDLGFHEPPTPAGQGSRGFDFRTALYRNHMVPNRQGPVKWGPSAVHEIQKIIESPLLQIENE